MRLPERDQLSVTREKMHADIAVAMGGRIAEEIIFGHDKVTRSIIRYRNGDENGKKYGHKVRHDH